MCHTDTQIQAAIDAAFPVSYYSALIARNDDSRWPEETSCRLAIARAFLAELGKIKPAATDDPYARLKAYAAAGARIRCGLKGIEETLGWDNDVSWGWDADVDLYEVHPDDLHLCPEYAPKHQDALENWNQYAEKDAGVDPNEVPWIPHDGRSCPLKDEEVEEFEYKQYDTNITKHGPWSIAPPSALAWSVIKAYRVLKWKPGFGPQAKAEPFPIVSINTKDCEPMDKATADALGAMVKAATTTFIGPDGKTWTRHTPGDPMPCGRAATVEILCESGSTHKGPACKWAWGQNYSEADIIGWRYADEQPGSDKEAVCVWHDATGKINAEVICIHLRQPVTNK